MTAYESEWKAGWDQGVDDYLSGADNVINRARKIVRTRLKRDLILTEFARGYEAGWKEREEASMEDREMKAYEIFNPTNGIVKMVVRYRWIARLIAWVTNLDYAERGEGWIA